MQSYVIYLIRHGAIDETLKGRYIGRTDVSLSEKGKNALRDIKRNFGYPVPKKVYSSPLQRCTETCGIIPNLRSGSKTQIRHRHRMEKRESSLQCVYARALKR